MLVMSLLGITEVTNDTTADKMLLITSVKTGDKTNDGDW